MACLVRARRPAERGLDEGFRVAELTLEQCHQSAVHRHYPLLRRLPELLGELRHGREVGLRTRHVGEFEQGDGAVLVSLHGSFQITDLRRQLDELRREAHLLGV